MFTPRGIFTGIVIVVVIFMVIRYFLRNMDEEKDNEFHDDEDVANDETFIDPVDGTNVLTPVEVIITHPVNGDIGITVNAWNRNIHLNILLTALKVKSPHGRYKVRSIGYSDLDFDDFLDYEDYYDLLEELIDCLEIDDEFEDEFDIEDDFELEDELEDEIEEELVVELNDEFEDELEFDDENFEINLGIAKEGDTDLELELDDDFEVDPDIENDDDLDSEDEEDDLPVIEDPFEEEKQDDDSETVKDEEIETVEVETSEQDDYSSDDDNGTAY